MPSHRRVGSNDTKADHWSCLENLAAVPPSFDTIFSAWGWTCLHLVGDFPKRVCGVRFNDTKSRCGGTLANLPQHCHCTLPSQLHQPPRCVHCRQGLSNSWALDESTRGSPYFLWGPRTQWRPWNVSSLWSCQKLNCHHCVCVWPSLVQLEFAASDH